MKILNVIRCERRNRVSAVLLWESSSLSRGGFLAPFSSVPGLFLVSAPMVCRVWIFAAFSMRISSRVFTLSCPTFAASGSGVAGSDSPRLILESVSCSSCLFFLARRTSENVLTLLTEPSLMVMARLTPLVVLGLLVLRATSEGFSFWLWD